MNKKIYLVKKDPTASKSENEWIQMSGSEFYSFIKSAAAQGRYFICLTDDIGIPLMPKRARCMKVPLRRRPKTRLIWRYLLTNSICMQ